MPTLRKYFLTGTRMGMISIGEIDPETRFYVCTCDCGKVFLAAGDTLGKGRRKSCGCRQHKWMSDAPGAKTHGCKHTKTYRIWSRMKERCANPRNKCFKYYGGRGIKVCERWIEFENFLADMGHVPTGLTIERIDVNGDYEPTNCRWATVQEQYLNRTDTRYLTAFGETKPAVTWLTDPRCKCGRYALYKRLELGWDHEKAIAKPQRTQRKCRSGRNAVVWGAEP